MTTTDKALKKRPLSQEDMEVQVLTIRLPVNVYKELREVAFRKNEKMNRIIVELVEHYLNKTRKK